MLHHRTFRPLLELAELEDYAGQLEAAARHGDRGTLWCFVTTTARPDGTVEVALFDRWFDGHRLRCEQLASRAFDSVDEAGVAPSLEFTAAVTLWAQRQNQEREDAARDATADERLRDERLRESAAAATELAELLGAVTKQK